MTCYLSQYFKIFDSRNSFFFSFQFLIFPTPGLCRPWWPHHSPPLPQILPLLQHKLRIYATRPHVVSTLLRCECGPLKEGKYNFAVLAPSSHRFCEIFQISIKVNIGILCGGDDWRLVDITLNSSKMPSIRNSFLIFLNLQAANFIIIYTECGHIS
jgi:hypothetical protein